MRRYHEVKIATMLMREFIDHLVVDRCHGGEGRIEEFISPVDGVQPVEQGDGDLGGET